MFLRLVCFLVLSTIAFCADPAIHISLVPFLSGFVRPLACVDDNNGGIYVVEQPGRIRVARGGNLQPQPFLDLTDRVFSGSNECGLLGLAFHPDFKNNGRFFVNYTTKKFGKLQTCISEFKAAPNATAANASEEREIMRFDQPWANHNGGCVEFGPDGMLYIGTGDGGSGGDPRDAAQNLGVILGKILRIDVDHGQPYVAPKDNPFVGNKDARPKIWAFGLRNPWRFSFDRETKQMWCGDVGQNQWEEVDIIERGKNYGWSAREGAHDFKPERARGPLTEPIKDYDHKVGVSITGGYVYRGKDIPALRGVYIYADYQTSRIFALKWNGQERTLDTEILRAPFLISSFGEDKDGELFICDHNNGRVFRIGP